MEVLQAIKPLDIQEVRLDLWEQRPIKNNFFELVLIKDGNGSQCINYNEYKYTKGDIFLLPPLKCHSFSIVEPTTFIFLKFSDAFFKTTSKITIDRNAWFKEAAYILSNYNQLPGDIITSNVDRKYIPNLFDMILQESRNYSEDSHNLITSLMTSILELLMRNIKKSIFLDSTSNTHGDERVGKMLNYINEHLDKPALLKVENLAAVFNMSSTYVSEFFKKQMNLSLREYIIKAKLKLVEIRLLNSDYTYTEIADELGFTDVSHLSKTFKRYTGSTLKEFKQNGEYQLLKRSVCNA